jgi:hypothetical protein
MDDSVLQVLQIRMRSAASSKPQPILHCLDSSQLGRPVPGEKVHAIVGIVGQRFRQVRKLAWHRLVDEQVLHVRCTPLSTNAARSHVDPLIRSEDDPSIRSAYLHMIGWHLGQP